jgi:TM2 domain-containing membrane protein YozV
MSDDPTKTDNWSSTESSSSTPPNETDRVGFCQDCGKPLSQTTIRTVGTGVFCEPCLAARVGTTSPSSGYSTAAPYASIPPQAATSGEPSPVMAAILGFIPGVGAMYNGQFAKGIVHLIIFAILVSLSDNVNGIFGLFVAGWVFYMAFEAYHTAIARRDGLPLPNAFGFNDIGERMGFGRTWGTVNPVAPRSTGPQQTPDASPNMGPVTGAAYQPVSPVPPGTAPDWVGYVPPSAFAASPPVPPSAATRPGTAWGHAPYIDTYTGAPQGIYGDEVPLTAGVSPDLATQRFPTGALWLIGLGVLILAANLLPDWRVTGRWWPPVLFAGLAAWTFNRRLRSGARTVCIIRWPVILLVLAIMSALHAAYFAITFGFVCSILLIVLGGLLLLERTVGASPVVHGAPGPPKGTAETVSGADAQVQDDHSRAGWSSAVDESTRSSPVGPKGEQ